MKKRMTQASTRSALIAILRVAFAILAVGVLTFERQTRADDPATQFAKVAIGEIGKLCDRAKAEYAPRFDSNTSAAKEKALRQLEEYVAFASKSKTPDVANLLAKIDVKLIQNAAEQSPALFQKAIENAEKELAEYARARGSAAEREKSLAVALGYYLAVSERPVDADANEEIDDEEAAQIANESKENFHYFCDELVQTASAYFRGEGAERYNDMLASLGEMLYYQPESPSVLAAEAYLKTFFSDNNLLFETSDSFLSALTLRSVDETFNVREMIRETWTQGYGVLRGSTNVNLTPNPKRAEMSISLVANVSTQTVGAQRGVNVASDNIGSVWASKPVFLNSNGSLSTRPAVAQARMKSTVRGVNTKRLTLFGGAIINNKVNQELPFSEQEGAARMKQRVANELETQANSQIAEFNRRFAATLDAQDSMVRDFASQTTKSKLYISCCVGKKRQFTAPSDALDAALAARAAKGSEFTYADVEGAFAAMSAASNSSDGRKRIFPRLEAFRKTALFEKLVGKKNVEVNNEADVALSFHQSAPNNAANIALAGVVFGPGYDALDDVLFRFPGVDPEDVKKLLKPYEPSAEKQALDPQEMAREIYVVFDEVHPFSTTIDDDRIVSVLHVSSCDVDGKEWGPVDVRLAYKIVEENGKFSFVREELEVYPRGYQEGDGVSARFGAFRRIFVKRLETAVLDKYELEPIPMSVVAAPNAKGALVVSNVFAQNGWFRIEFDYDPNLEIN